MSKLANEQIVNSPTKIPFSTRYLSGLHSQPDSYRVSTNMDLFFTDIFTTFTEKSSKLA